MTPTPTPEQRAPLLSTCPGSSVTRSGGNVFEMVAVAETRGEIRD
ncbi:hypothetical protein [Streptomyces sp. NPDC127098]